MPREGSLKVALQEGGGGWTYNRVSDDGRYLLELKTVWSVEVADDYGLNPTDFTNSFMLPPSGCIILNGQDKRCKSARTSGSDICRDMNELPASFMAVFDLDANVIALAERKGNAFRLLKVTNVPNEALSNLITEILERGISYNDFSVLAESGGNVSNAQKALGEALELETRAAELRVKADRLLSERSELISVLRAKFNALGLDLGKVLKEQIGPNVEL